MFSDELTPAKKMGKARANLVIDDVFFGSLSMRLHVREFTPQEIAYLTLKMGRATAATDGITLMFNPAYINELSLPKTISLLAHEVGHVALKHHMRRQNRDLDLWNQACDYAVNLILKEAKYDVNGWLYDEKFENMSAERIYRLLQEEQGQDGENGENGQGCIQVGVGQPGQPGQPGQQGQFGTQNADGTTAIDGIIIDIPIPSSDKEAIRSYEEGLTIAVEQAATEARKAGDLPGGLEYLVKTEKEHKIPWQDVLHNFLQQSTVKDDYSYLRVNRRYVMDDFFLPGYDDKFDQINIIICDDASGSHIDQESQKACAAEISGILEEFGTSFTVIYHDTRVTGSEDLDVDDLPLTLKPKGGGGTKFSPVFRYIKENKIEGEAIIFFTDLAASDWPKVVEQGDPGIPVLWLNTYRANDTMNVPFGTIVPLELD
jgi:predicted metal-dependent peptidase